MMPVLCFGQNVNIPDSNFKAYLLSDSAINTNGDEEIQLIEASVFTGIIECVKLNISDLTGIREFTSLTSLYCGENQLSTLDLSKNTALTELSCYNNQLTTLDLSKNTALTTLGCDGNQLSALDLSKNTALTLLYCYDNKFDCDDLKAQYGL